MIYVTEIPHQGPSKFWMALDRQRLMNIVSLTIEQRREGYDPQTCEDCIEYLQKGVNHVGTTRCNRGTVPRHASTYEGTHGGTNYCP